MKIDLSQLPSAKSVDLSELPSAKPVEGQSSAMEAYDATKMMKTEQGKKDVMQTVSTQMTPVQKNEALSENWSSKLDVLENLVKEGKIDVPTALKEQDKINSTYEDLLKGTQEEYKADVMKPKGMMQRVKESWVRTGEGQQDPMTTAVHTIGEASTLFGEVAFEGIKAWTPDVIEDALVASGKWTLGKAGNIIDVATGEEMGTSADVVSESIQEAGKWWHNYQVTNPQGAAALRGVMGTGEIISMFSGGRITKEVAEEIMQHSTMEETLKQAGKAGMDIAGEVKEEGTKLLGKGKGILEERKKKKIDKKIMKEEKHFDISESQRKVIQKDKEGFQKALDQEDLAIKTSGEKSAMGRADVKVSGAIDKLESLLSESSKKIGKFREKIKTTKIDIVDASDISNKFNKMLPDKIKKELAGKKALTGEAKSLNNLKKQIIKLKQSPDLNKLIQLRDDARDFIKNFDGAVVGQKSKTIDKISTMISGKTQNINKKAIGASEAAELENFHELATVLKDIRVKTGDASVKLTNKFMKGIISGRGDILEYSKQLERFTGVDVASEVNIAMIATLLKRGNFKAADTAFKTAGFTAVGAGLLGPKGLFLAGAYQIVRTFLRGSGFNKKKIEAFIRASKRGNDVDATKILKPTSKAQKELVESLSKKGALDEGQELLKITTDKKLQKEALRKKELGEEKSKTKEEAKATRKEATAKRVAEGEAGAKLKKELTSLNRQKSAINMEIKELRTKAKLASDEAASHMRFKANNLEEELREFEREILTLEKKLPKQQ